MGGGVYVCCHLQKSPCRCLAVSGTSSVQETYGEKDAQKWWVRWRLFYLACSELFKYNKGDEWGVTHLVFGKRK